MKVYYIGGSPCSGKSTVAEQIAREYDLFYFQVDDSLGKYADMGAEKGYPVCKRQWKLGPDGTWLREPRVQCEEEIQFYREIFAFVEDDVRKISGGQDMIAEGAAFLPELMKQAGVGTEQYFCMTPAKEFQLEHYRKRMWVPLMLEGCSDKEKAFGNWMARDMLFADKVREQCVAAGYRSVIIDGRADIQEIKNLVCRHFFESVVLNV